MAKNSVRQWDKTAANNTDIAGFTLGSGMLSGSVNNALQADMSQVAQYVEEMSFPDLRREGERSAASALRR
jgi:hypothetical protein